jgi:aspartate/methionine/tyrosine aminotransferase
MVPEGLPQFKESVAQFFHNKRNVPAKPEFTFPVDSAAFGIYVICKAFLEKGDEAIIFNPVDFLLNTQLKRLVLVPFLMVFLQVKSL